MAVGDESRKLDFGSYVPLILASIHMNSFLPKNASAPRRYEQARKQDFSIKYL